MSVRSKIDTIKHLQHRKLICMLEDPRNIVNIGSTIRNISAFGITKLYVIGGDENLLAEFETTRNHKKLTSLRADTDGWDC